MNRTTSIIDALEEVECAARELLREVEQAEELGCEVETDIVAELSDALDTLDLARVREEVVAHG